MRLLIIGDSHCRELASTFAQLAPEIDIYIVSLGSRMNDIIFKYMQKLPDINLFNPDSVIVHLGHNDIVKHPSKNPIPTLTTVVAHRTIAFCVQIQNNHPNATIHISATFPRTFTHHSTLTQYQVRSYNKKMKRQGQRLRTLASIANFHCLINNIMWRRISAAIEDHTLFSIDGLHLDTGGRTAVVTEWLPQINHV